MLSYKQIKRENHIIETLTVENEKFELYENNDFGDYVFFILVNVTKGVASSYKRRYKTHYR